MDANQNYPISDAVPVSDSGQRLMANHNQLSLYRSLLPELLAISLREVGPLMAQQSPAIPIDSNLRRALRASEAPAFIQTKKVESAITGKTKHCWCFRDGDSAALALFRCITEARPR
ncbi:hypothetical protein [Stutzerimonas stutzeri]|uniref:hypothetical protein n=1 Tax=Stutzerimonas stutzeri TaxID=316 RepID=UPI00210B84F5|nr:hypothetical protein [Stutzerimonas stutzeri]MCQ4321472.1 hypothetical protein [Stutzerimonas stutzeri]